RNPPSCGWLQSPLDGLPGSASSPPSRFQHTLRMPLDVDLQAAEHLERLIESAAQHVVVSGTVRMQAAENELVFLLRHVDRDVGFAGAKLLGPLVQFALLRV